MAERPVIGVFDERQSAQRAIGELRRTGFTERQIGVTAVAGAGSSASWGLGIVAGMLPAIGPAIAGGTLAAALSRAGLAGALVGRGVPEPEARGYERELKSGGTIVTVDANGRGAEACLTLQRFGGYDLQSLPAGRAQRLRTPDPREEVHAEHRTVEVPRREEVVIIERRIVSDRPDGEAKER